MKRPDLRTPPKETTLRSSANADLLLSWMSHHVYREGVSAAQINNAIESLVASEERTIFRRTFLRRLVLLGHALKEGDRWRVQPPRLLLLPHHPGRKDNRPRIAFLSGARTPEILEKIAEAAGREGVVMEAPEPLRSCPARRAFQADEAALARMARRADILLLSDAPAKALAFVPSLPARLRTAKRAERPTGAAFQFYDVERHDWRPATEEERKAERLPIGQIVRYGDSDNTRETQYFVGALQGAITADSPGEALFLAARLNGEILCRYDANQGHFFLPEDFPPEAERALCLCSGFPPQRLRETQEKICTHVPQEIADAILVRLGQFPVIPPKPPVFWLPDDARTERETPAL